MGQVHLLDCIFTRRAETSVDQFQLAALVFKTRYVCFQHVEG